MPTSATSQKQPKSTTYRATKQVGVFVTGAGEARPHFHTTKNTAVINIEFNKGQTELLLQALAATANEHQIQIGQIEVQPAKERTVVKIKADDTSVVATFFIAYGWLSREQEEIDDRGVITKRCARCSRDFYTNRVGEAICEECET